MANVTAGWARRRARAGASVLDGKDPGWAERIDRGRLNMASLHNCIIGQLSGADEGGDRAYDAYVERLGLSLHGQVDHGFLLLAEDHDPLAYELLCLAWDAEIDQRLTWAGGI
jgi:hypothetical protein